MNADDKADVYRVFTRLASISRALSITWEVTEAESATRTMPVAITNKMRSVFMALHSQPARRWLGMLQPASS